MIAHAVYSERFVGRREELAFLREELRLAAQGRVRFVTVEGEAGIGKTRLVAEFAAQSAGAAAFTLGHCEEHVESPYLPYGALLSGVDRRARSPEHLSWRDQAGPEKYAFFAGVTATLAREATRKPLVCVIEDLQWADAGTLELTSHLLRHLESAPVVFVLTLRSGDPPSGARIAGLRSVALRARAASIKLRGLARNEMRHLLQYVLTARSAYVSPESLAQIEDYAEGNPLFAEELLGAALDGGPLRVSENVPLSVQAILAERLATIDETHREFLVRAANLGRTFNLLVLAAVVERPVEAVALAVQRAVAAGLLVAVDAARHEYGFRHALIRRALADQLVFALAAPLHVRIATELERRPDASASAAELAYHWAAAHVPERAREQYELAAQGARRVHAYRDAIRYYSEALRWDYPSGPARANVYEQLGRLLYIEGCGEAPQLRFEQCRDEHRALGDTAGSARATLLLADQLWVDADTLHALEAADAAAAGLERTGEAQLLAQARLAGARYAMTLGDAPQAEAYLRKANKLRAAFAPCDVANARETRAEVRAARGDAVGALSDCRAAADLAHASADAELIAQTENNFALAAGDLGELAIAISRHERALHEAQRTAMAWRVAYSAMNFAGTLMLGGRLEAARTQMQTALDTGVDTATFKTKAASVGITLALLLNDRAMLEACADERALALAWQSGEIQRLASVTSAFAELRSAQGAQSEARALLERALQAVRRGHRTGSLYVAVARYGDASQIARARTILSASTGRPRVLRGHGLLLDAAAAGGRYPHAGRRFAAVAARQYKAIGWTLYCAYALEFAGQFEEAGSLYDAMGDVRDVERQRRFRPLPLTAPLTALSARQQQISDLVALGATNREIGRRLHISEHTVEQHLSNIFTRLGLRSRAQLTAYVVGRQGKSSGAPLPV